MRWLKVAISIAKDISALGCHFLQFHGVPCNSPKSDGCALKLSGMRTMRPRLRPRIIYTHIFWWFFICRFVSPFMQKRGPHIWKVFLVLEQWSMQTMYLLMFISDDYFYIRNLYGNGLELLFRTGIELCGYLGVNIHFLNLWWLRHIPVFVMQYAYVCIYIYTY
jgi:hypothetical protein